MADNAGLTRRYRLDQIFPGEQFRLCGADTEIIATLVDVNECEAKVRIATPQREVCFEVRDGSERHFMAWRSKICYWAPATCVERVRSDEKESLTVPATKKSHVPGKTKTVTKSPGQEFAATKAFAAKALDDSAGKAKTLARSIRSPKLSAKPRSF